MSMSGQPILGAAGQQTGGVFRGSTTESRIHVTVVDRSGTPVTGLGKDDFEVRVGGTLVPVTTFSNEPQPITAVLLLETSIVLADRFFQMRDAANQFVDALRPGDRVRIGSYSDEIALSPWLTGDTTRLKTIIAEELWPLGCCAPLMRAVKLAAESLADERRPNNVVVLGTRGVGGAGYLVDYPANLSPEDVRRGLWASRQTVNAVRFRGLWGSGTQLSYLARETGGGDMEVTSNADLVATFARLADELRSQYLLGINVQVAVGQAHRLAVRVPGRSNLTVRAPRGFIEEGR